MIDYIAFAANMLIDILSNRHLLNYIVHVGFSLSGDKHPRTQFLNASLFICQC